VFGVPDAEWGERVVAAAVPNPGARLDEADMLAWIKARMTPFKAPSRLHVVAELPKNGYGKIMKREVRALLYPASGKAGP
jgi:fatty-acyl-CoA synthase